MPLQELYLWEMKWMRPPLIFPVLDKRTQITVFLLGVIREEELHKRLKQLIVLLRMSLDNSYLKNGEQKHQQMTSGGFKEDLRSARVVETQNCRNP